MSIPVSVLTTVYNRERYLPECIESVLASSFSDFEYIIVDDCSTDRSYEIALGYAKYDSRISVYRNDRNLGDYPNRNVAALLAKGTYLKYIDSDDVIYPHGLHVMVEGMRRFPDAALGLKRPASSARPYPVEVASRQAYAEQFLGNGLLDCGPTGVILRAGYFQEAGGFSNKRFVGDTEMWLKLAARYSVVKMDQGLVWWRVHDGQEFLLGSQSLEYAEWGYKACSEAINSTACPLDPEQKASAIRRLQFRHSRRIINLALKSRRPRAALRIMKKTAMRPLDLLNAFGKFR